MPTYCLDLTVPKSTPKSSPVERELKIREGVIVRWSVLIPAGHMAGAGMRALYGLEPVFPAHEDAWLRGDDETVVMEDFWDPPEEPYTLTFQAWNEDPLHDHTFYVRLAVLQREVASAHQLFLKRVAKEISDAFLKAGGWV